MCNTSSRGSISIEGLPKSAILRAGFMGKVIMILFKLVRSTFIAGLAIDAAWVGLCASILQIKG